jgi:fructose PTS system EIIA component
MSKIKVINLDLILFGINVQDKISAIEEMSTQLLSKGYITDIQSFISCILKREEEGKTGIGYGVAIPHGKSKSVKQTVICIGKLQQSIKWESVDSLPIKLIILFAVKDNEEDIKRLDEMAEISTSLADESFIDKLHSANSPEEIIKLFDRKLKLN